MFEFGFKRGFFIERLCVGWRREYSSKYIGRCILFRVLFSKGDCIFVFDFRVFSGGSIYRFVGEIRWLWDIWEIYVFNVIFRFCDWSFSIFVFERM